MTDVSKTEVSPMTARRGEVAAHSFYAKGGAALNALLVGIADQKAAERMGSLQAALFLDTHYEMTEIPVVGSKQGETGNLPYDKYTKKIQTTDGERSVPGSFYTDVIHDSDEYQRIQTVKRWLTGNVEEGETVPDNIAAIAKTGIGNTMIATLNDRVSDMRVGLTKGSMLLHHVAKIAEINPERIAVKLPFRDQRVIVDGQPVRSVPGDDTSPFVMEQVCYGSKIRLIDPAKEFEDKVYSVSSFLQLKPDNELFLKEETKTIVNLDATTKRPPKTGADKSKELAQNNAKVPTNLEGGLTLFNALSTWIDQESDEGEKVYNQLLTKLASKDDDADETVMSVGKLCLALDALWTIIRPRYNVLNEAKAKAAMAQPKTGTTD